MIETWGFREDINVIVLDKDSDGDDDNNENDKDNDDDKDNNKDNIKDMKITRVSQLWVLIETWGFREDIKDIKAISLRKHTVQNQKFNFLSFET